MFGEYRILSNERGQLLRFISPGSPFSFNFRVNNASNENVWDGHVNFYFLRAASSRNYAFRGELSCDTRGVVNFPSPRPLHFLSPCNLSFHFYTDPSEFYARDALNACIIEAPANSSQPENQSRGFSRGPVVGGAHEIAADIGYSGVNGKVDWST